MRKISSHFGSNIKKAKIHRAIFSIFHFTSFIQAMPQLKELHLHDIRVYDLYELEDVEWPSSLPQETLNLKNLSILKISDCGEDFHNVLPVCDLQKVSFKSGISSTSSSFFENHFNIKSLSLGSISDGDSKKFSSLQLRVLSVFPGVHSSVFRNELLHVIATQHRLSKLDIYGQIDRPILTTIFTYLKQLKSLSFDLCGYDEEAILPELVSNLQKLTQLEVLGLRSYHIDIRRITTVRHTQIKKLFLSNVDRTNLISNKDDLDVQFSEIYPHTTNFSNENIAALRQAFPSLIELGLNNFIPTNVYHLLNTFDDIEMLSLRTYGSLFQTSLFRKTNRRIHLNVKKFFFSFHESQYDPIAKEFLEFLFSMPHLEVLDIWKAKYFDRKGLISALKKNLLKLRKLNLFENDSSDSSIAEGGEGSTVSLNMYNNSFALHELF